MIPRRPKEGPPEPADALAPVREREDVRAAAQALADATVRLTAAERALGEATLALASAEARAGAEWQGGALPPGLEAAHLARSQAASLVTVATTARRTIEARHAVALTAARATYRTAHAEAQRALVVELDAALLEVARINVQLGLLHRDAIDNLGMERMGQFAGSFGPLASEGGEMPMSLWAWRRAMGDARVLPRSDNADWRAVGAPLVRPALPASPILPREPLRDPEFVALFDASPRMRLR